MIFVAGENLIDSISYKNNKNIFKTFVGGSTLNTALALGRLSSQIYFFSRISIDFFGALKKIFKFCFVFFGREWGVGRGAQATCPARTFRRRGWALPRTGARGQKKTKSKDKGGKNSKIPNPPVWPSRD